LPGWSRWPRERSRVLVRELGALGRAVLATCIRFVALLVYVDSVVLETDGTCSVIPKDRAGSDSGLHDVEDEERR
jgi:hypothetical protein